MGSDCLAGIGIRNVFSSLLANVSLTAKKTLSFVDHPSV